MSYRLILPLLASLIALPARAAGPARGLPPLGAAQLVAAPPAPAGSPSSRVGTGIRLARKNILGVEMGYNSLGGLGPMYTRNLGQHAGLDVSAGLSMRGLQSGLRARWLILRQNVTPFVGLGVLYAADPWRTYSGADGVPHRTAAQALLVQGSAGVAWQAAHGFSIMASAGYTQQVAHSARRYDYHQPGALARDLFNLWYSSGPMGALSVGYSF
jgi:hypothetical protein